jgi:hypothetical protein
MSLEKPKWDTFSGMEKFSIRASTWNSLMSVFNASVLFIAIVNFKFWSYCRIESLSPWIGRNP